MKAIERLFLYIEKKEHKPTRFEKELGLSNGYLGTQLKRKADLGETILNKIIDYCLDLNSDWLLTGRGEMIKDEKKTTSRASKSKDNEYKNMVRIPLYDVSASAGLSTIFDNQNTQQPLEYIILPGAPPCTGALSVRGDSMCPALMPGDVACYKTIQSVEYIRQGEVYLLDIDDGYEQYLTVKYLQRSALGAGYIQLFSENKQHPPMDIKIANIRALAIVKVIIRYNTM